MRVQALCVCVLSVSAMGVVVDPVGDFLPTYTGTQGADLDVVTAEVSLIGGTIRLQSTLAGAIGGTPDGLYVFGFDRGEGTARFQAGTPPIGSGVLFDSVVVVRPDGSVTISDILGMQTTNLGAGTATILGPTLDVSIAASLLPSRGFSAEQYTWNLWPRQGAGENVQVSDFAPDNSNAPITVIPAAGTAALLGTAAVVGRRRRR